MELDLTNASALELADFYQAPDVWLRANMVISSDGHFLDENGSSRGLSSPLDLKVLLTLRAISDAVLVGAQTVRKEDYRPPSLAGEFKALNSQAPKLVIISEGLNFDLESRLFGASENPPIFITAENTTADWKANLSKLQQLAEVIVLPNPIDFAEVLSTLRSRGLLKIVCEGGPKLLSTLIDLNLVDELDITTSPVSVGTALNRSNIHQAIDSWPNRISARLGSNRISRIKR